MEIKEFRKITKDDLYDNTYNDGYSWSRVYEYPLVIKAIEKYYRNGFLIHNSSWGYKGIHIKFKDMLDKLFKRVFHSDILESNLKNTFIYDITKAPPDKEIGKYDIVISVSTLEEVEFDHLQVFRNLFDQVRKGGVLIATFDLNAGNLGVFSSLFSKKKRVLQLEKFETLFSKKIETHGDPLNGENSKVQNLKYVHLNCGIMVVSK
jgi:hypothetical protein